MNFDHVKQVYEGSNGMATKAMYDELKQLGPAGFVAVNLFRAYKTNARAALYRDGEAKDEAYKTVDWALENLCSALSSHAVALNIIWGWDENVLYIDLPTGQVCFECPERLGGPNFPMRWDGMKSEGAKRVCEYVARVYMEAEGEL